MSEDRFTCQVPGCTKGKESGHVLYRHSPPGDLFLGVCAEHFNGPTDVGAQAIEDDNQRQRQS